MRQLGIDPSQVPSHGTYREDEGTEPAAKRVKVGFNGMGQADNVRDLAANPTPILPRDAKHLLLDIEGCTTSISFVKETLFPFVLEKIDAYVNALPPTEYNEVLEALKGDLKEEDKTKISDINDCSCIVRYMVQNDMKVASLKSLQGQMWKSGYEKGDLKGHVFAEFVPFLHWMETHGVQVHIYSSGSVQAQKLLFGYSTHGDLTELLHHHFDISTSGNKKEASSYTNIAKELGVAPSELVFCSDSEAELKAAKAAGIGHSIMTVRPGNEAITGEGRKAYPQVFSLLQLCGI
jgi:2,3-diketo-5-methylthio-1-phosphopentane phosphatase